MIQATMPETQWQFFRKNAGRPFPRVQVEAAEKELDGLVHVLEQEGVVVRRPDNPVDLFLNPITTPAWQTKGGMYAAMPRDKLLTVGDRIIEAPMSWRSRQRESEPYRRLLSEYAAKGARWIRPPTPTLAEDFYTKNWQASDSEFRSVITEVEPTFDAADFMRFGKDIICQRSHVTNLSGIRWLQAAIGDGFRMHVLKFSDAHPMHIDATMMPLRPGLMLINPERVPARLTSELSKTLFQGWDLVHAPQPVIPDAHPLYMTSKWINMNVLSLDEERVLVEAQDKPMIALIKRLGLKPILVPFRHFNTFGGSFHCATCDVTRDSTFSTWLNAGNTERRHDIYAELTEPL
ncbi:MAG: amidinotransferase [Gammaproteobacteria bacterium]|nr:amidinotransferase [Gammaproteobacteria bacterium]